MLDVDSRFRGRRRCIDQMYDKDLTLSITCGGHVQFSVHRVANKQRQIIGGSHLLDIIGRHAPNGVGSKKDLSLIPVVVVLVPGLQCIRRAGCQQEVSMPPDGIQICGVTECPPYVMKPSILFKYGASHSGGCIPSMKKLFHPG